MTMQDAAMPVVTVEPASDASLPPQVQRVCYISEIDGVTDWALIERGTNTNRWIVNIHGHGSTGDQLYTRPDIRDDWLPMFRSLGYSILAVNLRGNAWMGPAAAGDLHGLLAWVRQTYGARQFIFVGGSMGGTSTLIYTVLHPEDVAAAVALCPATDIAAYFQWCRTTEAGPAVLGEIADAIEAAYHGTPEQAAQCYEEHRAMKHTERLTMPLAVVHGEADATIPVQQSRVLAEALRGRPTFRYVELPEGNHDAPLPYAGESLRWVLERLDQQSASTSVQA